MISNDNIKRDETYTFFAFSDVHGHFDALMEGLNRAGFDILNPKHILISCGDNFDRGSQNWSILCFLVDMLKKDRLVAIYGNHEFFLDELFFGMRRLDHYDKENGTDITCYNFINKKDGIPSPKDIMQMKRAGYLMSRACDEFVYFEKRLTKKFETKNYIFAHGFISTESTPSWRDATWSCGHREIKMYPQKKTVVFGHYFAFLSREFEEGTTENTDENNLEAIAENYYGDGYINIDSCTPYTKIVNVLRIEDEM